MRTKVIISFCIVILALFGITTLAMADTYSTEAGQSVYELQMVYPIPLVYMSDFGIGMQGKYYQKDNFYLGWYTPIRMIAPFEQKRQDAATTVDTDIQVKLLGTFGYTNDKQYFTFDTSILAGCRYWYTKSTAHNPTYNIDGSYESSTTSFECGLMSTIRWKLGESFKFKNELNHLNFDFYAYWPLTDDLFDSEARCELALGFSYTF